MDVVSTHTDFLFNLEGRIRNLSLPASNVNALIPLFEAVSNAIHAVQARFERDYRQEGLIEVSVVRRGGKDTPPTGFTIRDNGVGLNYANMNSFRTSDSDLKIARGGKGIGRLSWLKAFQRTEVKSRFSEDGREWERQFTFELSHGGPIKDHSLTEVNGTDLATTVSLINFYAPYEAYCPKRTETIASKLVGHFLPYLVNDQLPRVMIIDEFDSLDLRQFYTDNQERSDISTIKLPAGDLEEEQEFYVFHVIVKKQLKFLENGLHWMFYAGNDRVVSQECVDGQLGLKHIGESGEAVYVGLVAGPYLDAHVNQERTGFSLSSARQGEIHKKAINSAKDFLSEYIGKIRGRQRAVSERIITENPQFLPFRDNLDDLSSTI